MNKFLAGWSGVFLVFVLTACSEYVFGIDRTIVGEISSAVVYKQAGEKRALSDVGDQKRALVVFWSRQNRFAELELKSLCDIRGLSADLEIIAVNVDRIRPTRADKDSATAYLKALGCNFASYFDPNLTAFGQLGVTAVPSTFLIDSTGRIIWILAGYLVSSRQELKDQITGHTSSPIATWRSRVNSKAIRYYQLARQLQSRRQWRIAETNCAIAAGLDTTFPEPLVLLAELNAFEGRPVVADSLLRRALAVDSTCVLALALAAKLAFLENDTARTAVWARKALAAEPSLPVAHAFMAWIMAAGNRSSEFEEFLSKAKTTGSHDPFVLYVCARSEELLGNVELAAGLYRQALDLLNLEKE